MKIAFITPHLTFRGTCVALRDYAHYNEIILHNHSLITTPKVHQQQSQDNNECAYRELSKRFPVYFYDTLESLEIYLLENNYDFIYCIKHGQQDDIMFSKIPYVVHCVFDMSYPHGNVYAAVSKTVAEKFGYSSYVPHMVSMTSCVEMSCLRKSLHIPQDAIVIGRYGGMDTFNIHWVMETISYIVDHNRNIYFLFMNTPQWSKHPQIIHINPIANVEYKKRFITTCDAMIVPERLGHTFGLSIAEFQVFQKPIICFDDGNLFNNAHIDILGETGSYFSNKYELVNLILQLKRNGKVSNKYCHYTPQFVMEKFKSVFIDKLN